MIVSSVRSRKSSLTTISRATFRSSVVVYSWPRIHLRPAPLPAEPLGVADRQPRDLDLLQGLADGVELRRLDDGDHQFHATLLHAGEGNQFQDTRRAGRSKAPHALR